MDIELHTHPFLEYNSIVDVVEAMDKRGLDVLALESLESFGGSLYPKVLEETSMYYLTESDDVGIKLLHNGKYLLNAREYNTLEGFHILTVGYSFNQANSQTEIREIIEKGLDHNALVILDHSYVDNGVTRTAGHISEVQEKELEQLCREYSGEIALEWNGYCLPGVRRALKCVLNAVGHKTRYHDVNEKAKELSERLKKENRNVPLVTDTDLHARSRWHLSAMGTARIITDVEGECASDIVRSMKNNIFAGNYKNVEKYVGLAHLLSAYCIPILFPKTFLNPRS